MPTATIHPRLVVDDVDAAMRFCRSAFAGTELVRFADPSGKVVHAEAQIGDDVISFTEHDGDWNLSPRALGGSPLLLAMTVDDADATGEAMVANGATVIIPIDDRHYGRREGRIQDPSGHLWIIGQDIEDLTHDEIVERLRLEE